MFEIIVMLKKREKKNIQTNKHTTQELRYDEGSSNQNTMKSFNHYSLMRCTFFNIYD